MWQQHEDLLVMASEYFVFLDEDEGVQPKYETD